MTDYRTVFVDGRPFPLLVFMRALQAGPVDGALVSRICLGIFPAMVFQYPLLPRTRKERLARLEREATAELFLRQRLWAKGAPAAVSFCAPRAPASRTDTPRSAGAQPTRLLRVSPSLTIRVRADSIPPRRAASFRARRRAGGKTENKGRAS